MLFRSSTLLVFKCFYLVRMSGRGCLGRRMVRPRLRTFGLRPCRGPVSPCSGPWAPRIVCVSPSRRGPLWSVPVTVHRTECTQNWKKEPPPTQPSPPLPSSPCTPGVGSLLSPTGEARGLVVRSVLEAPTPRLPWGSFLGGGVGSATRPSPRASQALRPSESRSTGTCC